MKFRTKKELLEHLWKKGNDNKLVDRMMTRWEVYKDNGMYVLVNKDVIIADLKKKVEGYDKLVEEVWRLESENTRLLLEKNDLVRQMIEKSESPSDTDEIIGKICKYLAQTCHITVYKSDLKERLENN